MKLTIIGSGYVGLVTGACLSEVGHDVICLDNNQAKIKKLKSGVIPIYEPKLEPMILSNVKKNRLNFTTSYKDAINHAEVIFIAVDTPSKKNGDADLSAIKNVSISIAEYMTSHKLIVQKSTSPVGTYAFIRKNIENTLKKLKNKNTFDLASNPEFLKEGNAISDFMKPDRIIIGIENSNLIKIFDQIYKAFNRKSYKIQYMDIKSSELTKYAANAMLATKISFINEIANIADKLGVDIENVRKGIGADKRIGTEFLYPGCGYGGSCFPKDIKALISTSKDNKYNAKLLKSVEEVNDTQKKILSKKVSTYFNNKLTGKTFGVWGLAFKPNTDDVRYAPSITLIDYLLASKAIVKAYDPIASIKKSLESKSNYKEVNTAIKALIGADGLIICTEWKEFWSVDPKIFIKHMTQPVIFDGRNIFSPKKMKENGINYYGVGRGS